jgi:hypothetical protein
VHHRLTDKGLKLRRAGDLVVDRVITGSLAVLTPAQLSTFDKLLVRLLGSPGTVWETTATE